MKIKKFENISNDDFDYPYGGHVFVLARHKRGWGSIGHKSFKNDEFVPCMVSGNPSTTYDKRSFWIIGDAYSRDIDDFEIMKGSDKGFQEMIELYSKSTKFNL